MSVIFQGEIWKARLLGQDDLPAIETVFEAGRDYLEMVSAEVDIHAEAQAFLTELPPGKDIADKQSIGIFSDTDRWIGLMDVIRDYPDPGMWWIGLLLLRSDQRGSGLGGQILEAFSAFALRSGARELRLGVVGQNPAAFRFWQRMGFIETGRRPPRQADIRAEIVIEMRKGLTQ
jgi:RimJ/RimL family protein N-acetyltransferase